MRGCFEEGHGVALHIPARPAAEARSSAVPTSPMPKADSGVLRAEELTAAELLLKRRLLAAEIGRPDAEALLKAHPVPPDFRPALSNGIGSRLPRQPLKTEERREVKHSTKPSKPKHEKKKRLK